MKRNKKQVEVSELKNKDNATTKETATVVAKQTEVTKEDTGIMREVLFLKGAPLPSAESAGVVIKNILRATRYESAIAKDLIEQGYDINSKKLDILRTCFGISSELYEKAVEKATNHVGARVQSDGTGIYSNVEMYLGVDGISLSCSLPRWWTEEDTMYVDLRMNSFLLKGQRKRTAKDVNPVVFSGIIESIEDGEIKRMDDGNYVSDYPYWYNFISSNSEEVRAIIKEIADICLMDFRALVDKWGISGYEISRALNIPETIVKGWFYGKSECDIYIRLMIAEIMGYLKRRH